MAEMIKYNYVYSGEKKCFEWLLKVPMDLLVSFEVMIQTTLESSLNMLAQLLLEILTVESERESPPVMRLF